MVAFGRIRSYVGNRTLADQTPGQEARVAEVRNRNADYMYNVSKRGLRHVVTSLSARCYRCYCASEMQLQSQVSGFRKSTCEQPDVTERGFIQASGEVEACICLEGWGNTYLLLYRGKRSPWVRKRESYGRDFDPV